jgi:hypothetical protein
MIALIAAAFGFDPELDVHALVGLGIPDTRTPVVVGAGAALALPVFRPVRLEIGGDYAVRSQRGSWVTGHAGLRGFLWDLDQPVVSVFAHGGVGYESQLSPVVTAGMALDLEGQQSARPRLSVGYAYSPNDTNRVIVRVGAQFGNERLPDLTDGPTIVVPDPPPRRSMKGIEPGMVWLPNPVCEWTPTDEATAEIERLGLPQSELSVVSTRLLRAPEAPLVPARVLEEFRGPRPARFVIATSDYDHVTVDGEIVVVEDGVGVARVDGDEMVWIEVRGGGKRVRFPDFPAPAQAKWLPIPDDPPPPNLLTFRTGSSRLDATARTLVERLADNRGDWSYRIHGSYSEEGDVRANTTLAQRRAEAVANALVDAGVPPGAIQVDDVRPPEPGLSAEQQRSAVILPVERL